MFCYLYVYLSGPTHISPNYSEKYRQESGYAEETHTWNNFSPLHSVTILIIRNVEKMLPRSVFMNANTILWYRIKKCINLERITHKTKKEHSVSDGLSPFFCDIHVFGVFVGMLKHEQMMLEVRLMFCVSVSYFSFIKTAVYRCIYVYLL